MPVRLLVLRSNRTQHPSGHCFSLDRKKPSAYLRRSRPKSARYCSVRNSVDISRMRSARIFDILGAAALMFEPVERVTDCRDVKDNKYLELALAAGASVIVSSDNDLLLLDPWRGIRVLRPADYIRLRRAGG